MEKIYVPPIKIQGIKTKLVPLIRENIILDSESVWVEPFMGSGVVGFNVAPRQAVFADTNPHIIRFYVDIQEKKITSYDVRAFLEEEGEKLGLLDETYYYEVRDRFNKAPNSLDFLFLNRSCFNGMIRFNQKFAYNVPYGHKRNRFSKAYITKIVNQVKYLEWLLRQNSWMFLCQPFEDTIQKAPENAFIYCDPPYIGRNVDYYDSWDVELEERLHTALVRRNVPFMLSTWEQTKFRKNEYVETLWKTCHKITAEHFYHVGAKKSNRNSVVEALLMNYIPPVGGNSLSKKEQENVSFFDLLE